ncbi:hypothetical protein TNCV_2955871 [Trichonephila clavipes]|nr:hypothetical protein TNCV_2955871 [Trichonephila clavipes]
MTRQKTNLSRNTRKAKSVRRVIANQTEEKRRASVNEHSLQRMTQMRANEALEKRATRLEDARLCYDAFQYPIIFWDGADGYNFNVVRFALPFKSFIGGAALELRERGGKTKTPGGENEER